MMSRSLVVALVAGGCITAAAGGSYLAVRHNAEETPASPAALETPAPAVHESEGIVGPLDKPEPESPADAVEPAPSEPAPVERAPKPKLAPRTPVAPPPARPVQTLRRPELVRASTDEVASEPAEVPAVPAVEPAPSPLPPLEPTTTAERLPTDPVPVRTPVRAEEPPFEEIYIPASSVIGLELETNVSSEEARLEDRIEARVTRDVFASGRLAIPAGSRVTGTVTTVERGGKVKERARLGVRFHTLVLADGRQVALRTETIYREGESPANSSSKKIGGAAIGGAVLGAILGGKKGAIAGATAGAAGGTAMVMAGDREHATLPAGSIITVKLAQPVSFEVER